MPFMIALQKTLSPEQPDGKFSGFSKLPYLIQISLSSPLAEDGYGTVTVDGKLLPRGEQIVAMGHALLLLPVGLLAREYDRTYTVRLEGFRDVKGKNSLPRPFASAPRPAACRISAMPRMMRPRCKPRAREWYCLKMKTGFCLCRKTNCSTASAAGSICSGFRRPARP